MTYAEGMNCFEVDGIGFFIIVADREGQSHVMIVTKATYLDLEGPHAIRFPEQGYTPMKGQAILA